MSWEGEDVAVCENGHEICVDFYYNDVPKTCSECGGKLIKIFTFEYTNGDEVENKANKRTKKKLKSFVKNILKTSSKARAIHIAELEEQKKNFLDSISNIIANYDERIEAIRNMANHD